MLFIILFVLLSFTIPLTLEIYKKGSDNILTQSGKEILELPFVVSASKRFKFVRGTLESLSSVAIGAIGFIAVAIGAVLLFRVASAILSFFS